MVSRENAVILASALASVVGVLALVVLTEVLALPVGWATVAGFLWFVGVAYVLPQAYLMHADDGTPSTARLGVITLMLILITPAAASDLSGIQQDILWGLFWLSIGAVVLSQVREGYRQSIGSDSI